MRSREQLVRGKRKIEGFIYKKIGHIFANEDMPDFKINQVSKIKPLRELRPVRLEQQQRLQPQHEQQRQPRLLQPQ